MTRGINAVEDVLYGCGGEGGADVPSGHKAVISWCSSPGVKEVGWEGSKIAAAVPTVIESSGYVNVERWEGSELVAALPSTLKVSPA